MRPIRTGASDVGAVGMSLAVSAVGLVWRLASRHDWGAVAVTAVSLGVFFLLLYVVLAAVGRIRLGPVEGG